MIDPFGPMNLVGLLAFALVGSWKGIDADFDLFGVAVLGVLTALGGGVTRDLLVNSIPVALRSTADVSVALVGVGLAVVLARYKTDLPAGPLVQYPDAIGLSAFATTGAIVADASGLSPFGIVVLATVTGIGGGLVSDVLLGNVPFVLVEDFYATCAVAGGVTYWVVTTAGMASAVGALACAAVVIGLRIGAIRWEWELPTA